MSKLDDDYFKRWAVTVRTSSNCHPTFDSDAEHEIVGVLKTIARDAAESMRERAATCADGSATFVIGDTLRVAAAVFDDAVRLARFCCELSRSGNGACLGCADGNCDPEIDTPCADDCPIGRILAAAEKAKAGT